jgi:gas vesicle protein
MDPRRNEPTYRPHAGDTAHQAADYLRSHSADEIADDARAKADDMVDTAKDKVDDMTGTVREKASEVGTQASDKINDAMTSTGQQISNLAQTVRERSPEGQVGEVANATADALDRGGRYLQEQDLDGVRSDLEKIIRRYPIQSLLVGAGLSFVLARSMRR